MIVGITGGIGSGKTTIANIIRCLGYPVFNSDYEAKLIANKSEKVIKWLNVNIGPSVFYQGTINKSYLADKLFNNELLLQEYNKLIHPLVAEKFEIWLKKHKGIVFKEAAILIESGAYRQTDKIILVKSPLELRVNRVINRDKTTVEKVLERIAKQMPDDDKIKYADFIIENDGNRALIPQIDDLLLKLTLQA